MRTLLPVSLMILCAVSLAIGQDLSVLYATDFEATVEGMLPSGWAALGGSWTTVADDTVILQQSDTTFRGLAVAGRSWSNYDVVATVRLLAGQKEAGAGVMGYWSPSGDCYRLSTYGDVLAIWRVAEGNVHALAATQLTLIPEQPYRFRLSLRNENIGIRLAGKVWPASEAEPDTWALAALDVGVPLLRGRPGVFCGGAQVEFHDLNVTTAAGQVLVEERWNGNTPTSDWRWRYAGGDWKPPTAGQPLRQVALDDQQNFGASAYAVVEGWSNCSVQVSARSTTGGRNQGFGVAGYWQDDGSCYQFGQLANLSLLLARRTPMGTLTLATVPFAIESGTWYGLRLRVEHTANGVQLKGKIWPRRDREPTNWQIEAEDTQPPLLEGGEVAVWCLDDVCSFDDLVVRGNR